MVQEQTLKERNRRSRVGRKRRRMKWKSKHVLRPAFLRIPVFKSKDPQHLSPGHSSLTDLAVFSALSKPHFLKHFLLGHHPVLHIHLLSSRVSCLLWHLIRGMFSGVYRLTISTPKKFSPVWRQGCVFLYWFQNHSVIIISLPKPQLVRVGELEVMWYSVTRYSQGNVRQLHHSLCDSVACTHTKMAVMSLGNTN